MTNITEFGGKDPLQVEHLSTSDTHIVRVSLLLPDEGVISAQGCSRRHPQDKSRRKIGYLLAYGRAIENLSKIIIRRANGLVSQQDHMAKMRAERAAKPRQKPPVAKKASRKPAAVAKKTTAPKNKRVVKQSKSAPKDGVKVTAVRIDPVARGEEVALSPAQKAAITRKKNRMRAARAARVATTVSARRGKVVATETVG